MALIVVEYSNQATLPLSLPLIKSPVGPIMLPKPVEYPPDVNTCEPPYLVAPEAVLYAFPPFFLSTAKSPFLKPSVGSIPAKIV